MVVLVAVGGGGFLCWLKMKSVFLLCLQGPAYPV